MFNLIILFNISHDFYVYLLKFSIFKIHLTILIPELSGSKSSSLSQLNTCI